MGTFAYVQVASESEIRSNDIVSRIFSILNRVEGDLSRFKSGSLITHINQCAATSEVRLDAATYQLMKLCRQLHAQTGGSFDVTVGPLMDLWRQSSFKNRLPSDRMLQKCLDTVNSDYIQLNDDGCSIRFLKEGMGIDLGAIGKGYALDMVREQLSFEHGISAMINLGGNILQVGGMLDTFSIRHPLNEDKIAESIAARTCAVSTSSNRELSFCIEGREVSHLVDPVGKVNPDILSVTVSADSATIADAFSTILFLMDKEAGLKLAEEYHIRDVVMIYKKSKSWNPEAIRTEYHQLC